uniref:Uncharacterized protein n=1 Tax=Panagrolaimus sp. ES5 TaxID=591445 RepID=A0AC34FRK1_9BILA
MAELPLQERQKLFDNIFQSLHEYSKEDIPDPVTIKSEFVELLKTHRPLKLADYEYGLSKYLKKDYVIIVKEKEDETKVRLFTMPYWYCTNRSNRYGKCPSCMLKIKYGIVFAPLVHTDNCKPKDYSFVMEYQDLLKQGKSTEAIVFSLKKKRPLNDSSVSLSTSMLNESNLSSTTDMEDESILERSIIENTITSIESTSTSSPQQQSSDPALVQSASESVKLASSRVKREFGDSDYCMILDEPAVKKPKSEATANTVETYSFDHPSASILKKLCDKLNIKYSHDAYKLWANIIFNKISASSDNIKTHEISSSNIFACLSLILSGNPDNSFLIQHIINTAFCNASDSLSRSEVNQIFTTTTVTNEQTEFIAEFLACRIGIYENRKLKKFGNWKDENVALTLILSFVDGMYSVVLDKMSRFFNVKNDNSAEGEKIIFDEEINVLQPEVVAALPMLRAGQEVILPIKSDIYVVTDDTKEEEIDSSADCWTNPFGAIYSFITSQLSNLCFGMNEEMKEEGEKRESINTVINTAVKQFDVDKSNYSADMPLLEEHKEKLSEIWSTFQPNGIITGRRTMRRLSANKKDEIYILKKIKVAENEYYILHQQFTFEDDVNNYSVAFRAAIQCYFADVKEIIYGFYNDSQITLKLFTLNQLIKTAQRGGFDFENAKSTFRSNATQIVKFIKENGEKLLVNQIVKITKMKNQLTFDIQQL